MYECFLISVKVEDAKRREENLEEAKKITIEQDPTLPTPKKVIFMGKMHDYFSQSNYR